MGIVRASHDSCNNALVNGGRIFTPFWTEPVVFKPSALGGANWPPSSYDPESQTYYVCANDRFQSLAYTNPVNNEMPDPGERRVGGALGGTVSLPTFGILAAMDMTTNRLIWQQLWADTCYSGSAVTATGLLFIGQNDGRFTALDTRDGSRLWEFQTGAGVNAPPAIFEHGGTQHVVVYSAGNVFARSPRGDSVWLFSLDGTLDPVDPPQAAAAAGGPWAWRAWCSSGGRGEPARCRRGAPCLCTDLRVLPWSAGDRRARRAAADRGDGCRRGWSDGPKRTERHAGLWRPALGDRNRGRDGLRRGRVRTLTVVTLLMRMSMR